MYSKSRTVPSDFGPYGPNVGGAFGPMSNIGGNYWSNLYNSSTPWYAQQPEEVDEVHAYHMARNVYSLPSGYDAKNGIEKIVSTSGQRTKFNYVDHSSARQVCYPATWVAENKGGYGNSRVGYYMTFQSCAGYRADYSNYTVDSSIIPSHDWGDTWRDQVRARAWHSMQPRFEGNISMLNFLYELKDVTQLARLFSKAWQALDFVALRTTFRKYERLNKNLDPSKPAAELYLANEFGLKPLVSDIMEIIAQFATIAEDVQRQFKADGADWQTSHFSENVYTSSSINPSTTNLYPIYSGTYKETRFTATLKYKFAYNSRNTFDTFKRYWGLDLSAEAIWNAIPFSFLLDYFAKIGQCIKYMEHDPNVKLTEFQYGESLKSRQDSGLFIVQTDYATAQRAIVGDVAYDEFVSPVLISGSCGSRYTRTPTSPYYGPVLPRLKMASKKQATNIGALVRSFF